MISLDPNEQQEQQEGREQAQQLSQREALQGYQRRKYQRGHIHVMWRTQGALAGDRQEVMHCKRRRNRLCVCTELCFICFAIVVPHV